MGLLPLISAVASWMSIKGKSVVILSTSMPSKISLLPLVVRGMVAQLSPSHSVVPPTAPKGWGPFLTLIP